MRRGLPLQQNSGTAKYRLDGSSRRRLQLQRDRNSAQPRLVQHWRGMTKTRQKPMRNASLFSPSWNVTALLLWFALGRGGGLSRVNGLDESGGAGVGTAKSLGETQEKHTARTCVRALVL